MSRRDFFARFAGRESGNGPAGDSPTAADHGVLQTFLVKGFPYHSGPVLVPILKAGDEYRLVPDPPHSRDPTAVRIERGRDLLGYVPDEHVAEILARLNEGEPLVCRAVRVDPAAELSAVLTVEVIRPPPPAPSSDADDGDVGIGEGRSGVAPPTSAHSEERRGTDNGNVSAG